ncbi:helix-turn-helix domain-containing protein [Nocardia africana]
MIRDTSGQVITPAQEFVRVDDRVRPEIASSWLRSRMNGLRPAAPPQLDMVAGNHDSRLMRSAEPILRRISDDLAEVSAGVILADGSARILDARAGDPTVREWMYDIGAIPGARFGEDNAGTNAIGTPLEIRRDVSVVGEEHFHEGFKLFGCHGRPIRHPFTNRVVGVLDICFRGDADNRLFGAIARRAVADVVAQLAEATPRREQLLAAAFAAAGGSEVKVALGDGSVLATSAAIDLLDSADHAALRALADDVLRTGRSLDVLRLASGEDVDVCWIVAEGVGVVASLTRRSPQLGGGRGAGTISDCWPVLVIGERGSGRTTRAREIIGTPDAAILDGVDAQRATSFNRELDIALSRRRGGVIVENVHLLGESQLLHLASRLRRQTIRTVLTATSGPEWDEAHSVLGPAIARQEVLAPLRSRRGEIPAIATAMLSMILPGRTARFTPAALCALAGQEWHGNLVELHRVVETVAETHSHGDIGQGDLPPTYRECRRLLTAREEAEREVILAALRTVNGNRTRAASLLGVSRSTLYNRIRLLGIDRGNRLG